MSDQGSYALAGPSKAKPQIVVTIKLALEREDTSHVIDDIKGALGAAGVMPSKVGETFSLTGLRPTHLEVRLPKGSRVVIDP